MNHAYSLLWNDATQRYVPAPETARRRGKTRAMKALGPVALLLGALLASHAGAQVLPIVATQPSGATVQSDGNKMTIEQPGPKAVLHWQSFNIGHGASVHFDQKHARGIALNRVVGGGPSQIDGSLTATGQVWLVNPNGVVFGGRSRVDVGGLVASTLEITDSDFAASNRVFTRDPAKTTGGITVEEGAQITVTGGARDGLLALMAPKVSNQGVLTAQKGNVVLAAGDRLTLKAGANGWLNVEVDPATVQTLIENKKMIIADGGQVVMTSRAANALSDSMVSNSGTVQARTLAEKEGRILLLADMRHGEVVHSGLLDASAPDGGQGGFVETSAAQVTQPAGRQVTTRAAGGDAGTWSIVSHGGNVCGAQLSGDLAEGNVSITTASQGDIHVNDTVSWSQNKLTLNAQRNININAIMTASGTAALEMNHGGYSAATPAAVEGSGVHMALSGSGFTGRVDFTEVLDQSLPANRRLTINGDSYTLLTALGVAGSTSGLDLQGIHGNLSGKYALGANIDASGTAQWNGGAGFAPIGSTVFTGIFDGLGHTINKLTIQRPGEDYVGLFGSAQNATLRNVGLQKGRVEGGKYVGGLVGTNGAPTGAALISHAYATGDVTGKAWVGGLVGLNFATGVVKESVEGRQHVDGLIGMNEPSAYGTALISNAHANGNVAGEVGVGGLVGHNVATGGGKVRIVQADATGRVSGKESLGGLVGQNTATKTGEASIIQASSSGQVSSDNAAAKSIGGLVGKNEATADGTALISKAHAKGNVSGEVAVGGLVGLNVATWGGKARIVQADATGRVSGKESLGGLVGQNAATKTGEASIIQASSSGQVSSDNAAANSIGGLVGFNMASNSLAKIDHSSASGNVHGIFGDAVGGLIGKNIVQEYGQVRISHGSYDKGTVEGRESVGGLLGLNQSVNARVSISGSNTAAKVSGKSDVGGLVGRNLVYTGKARISRAKVSGQVQGEKFIGGLVGTNKGLLGGATLLVNCTASGKGLAKMEKIGQEKGSNPAYSEGSAPNSTSSATPAAKNSEITSRSLHKKRMLYLSRMAQGLWGQDLLATVPCGSGDSKKGGRAHDPRRLGSDAPASSMRQD